MDLADRTSELAVAPMAHLAGAHTRVLAEALAHVLGRDDDRPARWRMPSFGLAVDRSRAELDGVAAVWDLPATPDALTRPIGFDEAVARIARNPDDVAIAVRRLELGARTPLPSWSELVRRGLPSRPSDLDTALWFG